MKYIPSSDDYRFLRNCSTLRFACEERLGKKTKKERFNFLFPKTLISSAIRKEKFKNFCSRFTQYEILTTEVALYDSQIFAIEWSVQI